MVGSKRVVFAGVLGAVLGVFIGCGGDDTCADESCTTTTDSSCTALEGCCAMLPASQTPTECDAVVSGGTATACSESLTTYQSAGYCKTATATASCATLEVCCSQLTSASAQSECLNVVSIGDTTTCAAAQVEYVNDGVCTFSGTSGSGSSTSGAGPTAASCLTLETCCASLPSADVAACESAVSANVSSECTTDLDTVQASGYCGGSGSGSSSSGTASECAALAACCATMSETDETQCNAIVSAGGSECAMELASLTAGGRCESGSGSGSSTLTSGCVTLGACCASVPAADESACNEVVSENDSGLCIEELGTYESAGYCGGSSGTGSGSSSSSGGGCTALGICCPSLPENDQATCQMVVADDDDSECSSELTGYMSDGFCD